MSHQKLITNLIIGIGFIFALLMIYNDQATLNMKTYQMRESETMLKIVDPTQVQGTAIDGIVNRDDENLEILIPTQTKYCEDKYKNTVPKDSDLEFYVGLPQIGQFIKNKSGIILVPFKNICVKKDLTYNLVYYKRDPKYKYEYQRKFLGKGKIKKIEIVNTSYVDQKLKEIYYQPAYIKVFQTIKIPLNKKSGLPETTLILHLDVDMTDNIVKGLIIPNEHPSAKLIDKNFIKTVKPNEYKIIDIRPKTEFAKKSLPLNSVNFPLKFYLETKDRIITPDALISNNNISNLDNLKVNKNDNLIIVAQNSIDMAAYNFISYLAVSGFKNLFWYRDGVDDWYNLFTNTPTKSKHATIVDAENLKTMLKNSLVIDIRTRNQFSRLHIPNSRNVTYVQQSTIQHEDIVQKENISYEELVKAGESFAPRINQLPKTKNIIIVGNSEKDWRGYKALIWLKHSGFTKLFWYRSGMAEWTEKNLIDAEAYPLTRQDGKVNE